jgi:FKBP-type peptidyl-prolyl cis-trans isomerase FkpA
VAFPTLENIAIPTVEALPTTTASGLQVYELQTGSGATAAPGDFVFLNYSAWVQGSHQFEGVTVEPIRFRLTPNQVIQGWIEGISGMQEGGKRRLVVPPDLAYGDECQGREIPPNATLIYDIELVEVRPPQ